MDGHLASLFAVHIPVTELFVRGSVIFWFLFVVFRFVLRRDVGGLSMADTLLLVIVADASQNAMAGEYKTISEGIILLSTILGWNLLLDALAYRFSMVARFVTPRTLVLVRHGEFVHATLKREMLSPEEVMGKLREQGVQHLRDVRHAYLESDGQVSVMRYRQTDNPPTAPSEPRPVV